MVDLKVAADGSLYYLRRFAWVKDKDFKPHTGVLYRVQYTGLHMPPRISTQPADQTVLACGAAYFRVEAEGRGPLRFQWQRNGTAISGATSPTYLLSRVSRADQGARFRCMVANAHGQTASTAATLTIQPRWDKEAARVYGGIFIQPAPGTYTGPIEVRLSVRQPRVVLRFNTDGSAPTATSPVYDRPIPVVRTTTLSIRMFARDKPIGAAVPVTFTIHGSVPYGLPYRPAVSVKVPPVPNKVPGLLSQTGVFVSLADLTPAAGVVPYQVNTPLWSDGAAKRRWIALPPGGRIGFAADGEWTFPAGTVFIKHFELPTDETHRQTKRRLETRLLVVDGTGYGYGVTYRWRPDGKDADLLVESLVEDIAVKTAAGGRTQTWHYPSQQDCLTCHTRAAGFVLGVKTRQLNGRLTYPSTGITDNQLRTWNLLGMFKTVLEESRIKSYRKLAALADTGVRLEVRARSYLDANCAGCHRPGNPIQASFDARFDTPLDRQAVLDAPTRSDSLGLINPRVIAPGDRSRSMLYQRLLRTDRFLMPPLARHVPDRKAMKVLQDWIQGLEVKAKTTRGKGD